MAKRTKNKEKDNQVIYKTIHRKLKIDQHESHKKREWIQVLRKIKQFRFSVNRPVDPKQIESKKVPGG
jgi:hypothetical protein